MAPSTHQAKRSYAGTHSQSTMTSYFTSQSPSQSTSQLGGSSPSARNPPSAPPLPDLVQSNLLSVGMRVRKSVPEGYKTGTYSAFELFSDNPTTTYSNANYGSSGQGLMPGRSRTAYSGIGYRGSNELAPFCGIMKVGGLAVQDGLSGDAQVPSEDEVPFLSSQGSTISGFSMGEDDKGNKRRLDEEDEGEVQEGTGRDFGISEFDKELSRQPMSRELGERTIAIPRSKRRGPGGRNCRGIGVRDKVAVVGQENVDVGMDFGEAEFLDYGVLEMDMGDL